MLFASDRVELEWHGELNVRLRTVLLYLDWFLKTQHHVDMVLTGLLRTREEQLALYPGKVNPPTSVHEVGRGADVRTRDWPVGLAKLVETHLNKVFRYSVNTHHETALWHDVGAGEHLHVQVSAQPEWRG